MESRRRGPWPPFPALHPLSPPLGPSPAGLGAPAPSASAPPSARSGPAAPSPASPGALRAGGARLGWGRGGAARGGGSWTRGRGAPAAAAISAPRSRCPFMEMKDPAQGEIPTSGLSAGLRRGSGGSAGRAVGGGALPSRSRLALRGTRGGGCPRSPPVEGAWPRPVPRARSFSGAPRPSRPLPTPGASPKVLGRRDAPPSGSPRVGFGTGKL